MTKRDIVLTVAEKLAAPKILTGEIVQQTFDVIIETLVESGRIELRNFGVFEVRRRKPRKARNPRTGEAVKVPAKCTVTFKPGKTMEAKVAARVKKKKVDGTS
jgi:nucleoid DNA-binding protein